MTHNEKPVESSYGGSHRPLHGVANVKSSVANDETEFKVFNFKGPIRKTVKLADSQ